MFGDTAVVAFFLVPHFHSLALFIGETSHKAISSGVGKTVEINLIPELSTVFISLMVSA